MAWVGKDLKAHLVPTSLDIFQGRISAAPPGPHEDPAAASFPKLYKWWKTKRKHDLSRSSQKNIRRNRNRVLRKEALLGENPWVRNFTAVET